MSDSAETSPTLLNNLRCFRFQKKPSLSHDNGNSHAMDQPSTSPDFKALPAKKKILPLSDSESESTEEDNEYQSSGNRNGPSKSEIEAKEHQLRLLLKAFPKSDTMDLQVLQDVLSRHNWNAEEAIKFLMNRNNVKRRISNVDTKKKKVKRRKLDDGDSDDSNYGADDYADTRVFDSDEDSDFEVSNELTGDKKRVLDFLQNSTVNELKLMSSCSQKKAEAIMQCRPFTGWVDLVAKLQDNKYLTTDILNSAQDVLITRSSVQLLMKKCNNLAQQMEKAVAAGAGVVNQPKLLNPEMKLTGYQMIGLNWLAVMNVQGVNGILADEMGLGKTVQVIAFLAHLKETGRSRGTHLIIVPASTLDNWKNEFDIWCPSMNVFVYYGSAEERREIRCNWFREGLNDIDVILTTYTVVTGSPEERKMFRILQMHYVVFDEAHMLKNMNTQRYENLVRIKAWNRILLTGTPLQNNLLELMSLLIFVMPTMFAGKTDDLKSLFAKNSKTKVENDDDVPAFERDQIAQAKRIMKPFLLRRLKIDVLKDLPKKTDEKISVPLGPLQKKQYEDLVRSFQNADGPQICASGEYSGMSMMTDLRKLSNHPCLLRYHYTNDVLPKMAKKLAADPLYKETKQEHIIEDLSWMSDFEIYQLTKEYPCIAKHKLPQDLILESGKFKHLDNVLSSLKQDGHRVLIFSQFVIMLNVLEEYMKLRNHSFLRLDGQTPVTMRQDLITEFNEDPSIFAFLLSTKAGGLGINLTAADTVIIHDIDFNPYNDKQAEDRCHRMGQEKPVSVYRLVSAGTIEEAMFEMAQEKLKLEREITTDAENETTELKSVVKLLTVALGLDSTRAATLMTPSPKKS